MNNMVQHTPGISAFLAVLQLGSTLAAAKELNVSQATVSRRIKQLERSLGVKLFEQDTRGSRPTANARKLQDAALEVGESVSLFAKIADELNAEENHHITVGGPGPLFDQDVTDILADFLKKFPKTKFKVHASDKKEEVYDGTADVAVTFSNLLVDPDCICRGIGSMPNGFYAAHEYAAINGLPASETDLKDHKFVTLVGKDMPPIITEWMAEKLRPEQIVEEVDNFRTLVAAIQMGQGIGPLPGMFGDRQESLVRAFPPPKALDMPCWLAISPHAAHRPIVRKFSDFFVPRFRRLLESRV